MDKWSLGMFRRAWLSTPMANAMGKSVCSFIDLWGEKYPMHIPNTQLKDVSRVCSRAGWCLMLQGNRTMFLWNPFVNKVIQIPDFPHESKLCFFPRLIKLLWWVVLMNIHSLITSLWKKGYGIVVNTQLNSVIIMESNTWTFFNGVFYCLDTGGQLLSFEEGSGLLIPLIKLRNVSYHQSYLLGWMWWDALRSYGMDWSYEFRKSHTLC